MMTKTQNDQPGVSLLLTPEVGNRLAPLFTWRGRDVYPIFGGAEDGGSGDDGGATSDSDADVDDTETEEPDTSGSEDQVSRADFDKLKRQLQAADKNRSALEKRLKELDDKDKGELQKATERVTELEKTTEKQAAELAKLRLDNAFLSAETGITWHDPGDALALAERKGYLEGVVEEDGKVNASTLKEKLKQLAKASPHLVKSGSNGSSSNGSGSGTTPPRTGGNVGGQGGKDKDKGPDLSRYSRFLNT